MSKFILGLTGGIGSGKSAIGDSFRNLGIEVIDADQVARDVVKPGTPALNQIATKFGQAILNQDGSLNRAALRQQVFADPELKNWLNQLLHPLIRKQMFAQCQQAKSAYAVLEVPLLIEGGLHEQVDNVLVVDVPEATQIARASQRDNTSSEDIQRIMEAQASRQQRLAVADYVIDNSGSLAQSQAQVSALHKKLIALCQT